MNKPNDVGNACSDSLDRLLKVAFDKDAIAAHFKRTRIEFTKEEEMVLASLQEVRSFYISLYGRIPNDDKEMCAAISKAQRVIMNRAARRLIPGT